MRTRSQQPAHRCTTAHLRAAYPLMAEEGLGTAGAYIGVDLSGGGGSFVYDPWDLYGRVITGPGMVIMGELGEGKSALTKGYVLRQIRRGRRAVMLSVKQGETDRLCAAVGGTPVRLEPGGTVRLNPLDPLTGNTRTSQQVACDQVGILSALASAALGRDLSPIERTACELALDDVRSRCSEPVIPAVVESLLRPARESAASVAMSTQRLIEESRHVALELRRLCAGDLRGMFDGPTSTAIDLDAPLVCLDLSAVYSSPALGVLMTCAAAWMQRVVTQETTARRILVVDEAWAILRNLGVARWLAAMWKLARGQGVQCIAVIHRISDLSATGSVESEQVALARGLLADSETRVIHSLRPEEIAATRSLLDLSDAEASVIASLTRGTALWKVGRRSFVVQHRLTEEERWIVDTDQRMQPETDAADG